MYDERLKTFVYKNWVCFNEVALPYHKVNHLTYTYRSDMKTWTAERPYKLFIKILVTGQLRQCHYWRTVHPGSETQEGKNVMTTFTITISCQTCGYKLIYQPIHYICMYVIGVPSLSSITLQM